MPSYYNEIDPYAAQWLRNLIAAGRIAPGDVDTRSIEDVHPDDLKPYAQCHFFAGIGGWSLALRNAGWPDADPVWTGSCPCQPFSIAGKGKGFAEERHLWPAFHHLIVERWPPVIFGEQVASPDGLNWLDLVSSDLEGEGYACGAVDICAAGVGAPHIRQRLYWVADAGCYGRQQVYRGPFGYEETDGGARRYRGEPDFYNQPFRHVEDGLVAHPMQSGRAERGSGAGGGQASGSSSSVVMGQPDSTGREPGQSSSEASGHGGSSQSASGIRLVGDSDHSRLEGQRLGRNSADERVAGAAGVGDEGRGPTNGFWRAADWLRCRDGKWRSVEPGTFPLAHGVPARVGKLRAYGNAIVPQVAEAFIRAYLEI